MPFPGSDSPRIPTISICNVDNDGLILESSPDNQEAPALLDCCFQGESVALSAASDGSLFRYVLDSGVHNQFGSHDDLATCVEYSDETSLIITGGWDKKIRLWDARSAKSLGCSDNLGFEVESMSVSGFNLMVSVGSSVSAHDLRNFNKQVSPKQSFVDIRIKCVRSILGFEGFVVGSIDGLVALQYTSEAKSKDSYAFQCHRKEKDGRHHLVTVNDIAFSPFMPTIFATGDNEGYASTWDARSKKRLYKFPRFPSGVASLSYNHNGLLLAVASSYTYQEANEREEMPQIFLHEMNELYEGSLSAGSSK